MDVVYVLGNGSRWKNNELKYSLRSIEKYLKFGKVFIVGEKPDWIKDIIHIPATDPHRANKERNIYEKILLACNDDRISNNFFFFNDDHFLLKKVDRLEAHHREPLEEFTWGRYTMYKHSANNTISHLKRRSLSTFNYDIHCPIVYNKEKFKAMDYNWNVRYGYLIKSLYGNTHQLQGRIMEDCKIQTTLTIHQLKDRVKDRWVFSIGDGAICKDLVKFMDELYPEKSRFEI